MAALDDDPGDLKLLKRHLQSINAFEVEMLGFTDWEVCQQEYGRRPVDVIFLDYFLGGKTGLDIVRSLRGGGDDRPIIILTGQGNERIAAEISRAGADDYLIKEEITPNLLRRSIQGAMERYRLRGEKARLAAQLQRGPENGGHRQPGRRRGPRPQQRFVGGGELSGSAAHGFARRQLFAEFHRHHQKKRRKGGGPSCRIC